jgi:hypothetical protein
MLSGSMFSILNKSGAMLETPCRVYADLHNIFETIPSECYIAYV